MRVAVIYLEKKFIVVIPENSSVADLKTEIERVHCALFQSSGPPQPVTEIQTLSGCVLYGGYTISSVLSDNDTVIASGAGGVTPSTGDGHTNSPRLCAYTSPSQLSFCGYIPLGYYSPVMGS
ncbi:hypothetical protein GBAR_LOCUS14068 [Geodia barretti]|uniref:Uncharacterized protein n=1 Tax=Geodia barretti TaxID=519541 RepID=A0AA35WRW9_GEOBA|nr:hypothetical protein GBAR_LOCUS14068 [Geodia barretti]